VLLARGLACARDDEGRTSGSDAPFRRLDRAPNACTSGRTALEPMDHLDLPVGDDRLIGTGFLERQLRPLFQERLELPAGWW
jgi:hypothetical protein